MGAQLRIAHGIVWPQRFLDPVEMVGFHRANALDGRGHSPLNCRAHIDHDALLWSQRLAQGAHKVDIAILLDAESRLATLAKAHLDAMHTRLHPSSSLCDESIDCGQRGMTGDNGWQTVLDRST